MGGVESKRPPRRPPPAARPRIGAVVGDFAAGWGVADLQPGAEAEKNVLFFFFSPANISTTTRVGAGRLGGHHEADANLCECATQAQGGGRRHS